MLSNCKICGKVFSAPRPGLCPDCHRIEEEQFERVKQYLHEHKGAGIDEVAAATEVPHSKILEFLRLGRLTIDAGAGGLSCRMCGKPIASGQLCLSCMGSVLGGLKSGSAHRPQHAQPDRSKGLRMHIADRYERRRQND